MLQEYEHMINLLLLNLLPSTIIEYMRLSVEEYRLYSISELNKIGVSKNMTDYFNDTDYKHTVVSLNKSLCKLILAINIITLNMNIKIPQYTLEVYSENIVESLLKEGKITNE